jgi:DNA-binding CsgD family transcriptional regulator
VRSPSDTKLASVEAWYTAYNERDLDALYGLAHHDIVVIPFRPLLSRLPGTTFHGHTGLHTLMQFSFETYPESRVETYTTRGVSGFVLASTTFVVVDRPVGLLRNDTHSLFDVDAGFVRRLYVFAHESEALATAEGRAVLTPREREIFGLLAAGLSTQQVADDLVISPATVRTHVRNGIANLGANNKTHAISMALKRREISG